MAKIKLTKSAVDAAQPQDKAVELRDAVVPGLLCKITPAGRKPALGQYGELTVDQARTMAQEWRPRCARVAIPARPRTLPARRRP